MSEDFILKQTQLLLTLEMLIFQLKNKIILFFL